MNKIKFMLLSLLVVGAVGGAVAFKASRVETLLCGTTTNSCPTQVDLVKTTSGSKFIAGTFCTTGIVTTDCPYRITTNN